MTVLATRLREISKQIRGSAQERPSGDDQAGDQPAGDETSSDDRVRVLVALSMRDPSADDLKHVQELGLEIEQVIKNKLIGSIDNKRIKVLRDCSRVESVEVSGKLRLHVKE